MSWQVLHIRFGLSSSVHSHRLKDFIIQGSPAVKLVKFFRGFCGLFESQLKPGGMISTLKLSKIFLYIFLGINLLQNSTLNCQIKVLFCFFGHEYIMNMQAKHFNHSLESDRLTCNPSNTLPTVCKHVLLCQSEGDIASFASLKLVQLLWNKSTSPGTPQNIWFIPLAYRRLFWTLAGEIGNHVDDLWRYIFLASFTRWIQKVNCEKCGVF